MSTLAGMDEARRHVLRNLVSDERDITRLALYERQINAQFKSTYSLLERARAWASWYARSTAGQRRPDRIQGTRCKRCLANGFQAAQKLAVDLGESDLLLRDLHQTIQELNGSQGWEILIELGNTM